MCVNELQAGPKGSPLLDINQEELLIFSFVKSAAVRLSFQTLYFPFFRDYRSAQRADGTFRSVFKHLLYL